MQRELEAYRSREPRLEAELASVRLRASETEKALDAAEKSFAEELAMLRDLALRRESLSPSQPPKTAAAPALAGGADVIGGSPFDSRRSSVAALETLCSDHRALPDTLPPGHPPPSPSPVAQRVAAAAVTPAAANRVAQPAAAHGVYSGGGGGGDIMRTPSGLAHGAAAPAAVEAATPLVGSGGAGGARRGAGRARDGARDGAADEELAALREANAALRRELELVNDQLIERTEADLSVLHGVAADGGGGGASPPGAPAHAAWSPPLDPLADERERWRREVRSATAARTAHAGPGRRARGHAAAATARRGHGLGTAATDSAGGAAGAAPARDAAAKPPAQPAGAPRSAERRKAEQRVHEQIRALLVAKETALSAVAQL